MRISNIRVYEKDGYVSLLADCKIRPVGKDIAYFTVEKKYKDLLSTDASPFAAAFLVPAMQLNEDLIIDAVVSEQLYQGMHEIMEVMTSWNIGLHRIKIIAKATAKDTVNGNAYRVGTFFSGGVDSFYTYLKHKDDAEDPITHFILIRGNDISLQNRELWNATLASIKKIANAAKVELITVESNLQSLTEPMMSPDFTHGGVLGAVGLALRGGFKKIYIPATFSMEEMIPWGSHPDTDAKWGTETISFEHDGTEADRLSKVLWQVADSPLALDNLRVCYYNVKGAYNCGECEKCLRTMTELLIAGKLGVAKTFPGGMDPSKLSAAIAHSSPPKTGHEQALRILKEKNIAPDIQRAIEDGLAYDTNTSSTKKDHIIKKMVSMDYRYLRGVLYALYQRARVSDHY